MEKEVNNRFKDIQLDIVNNSIFIEKSDDEDKNLVDPNKLHSHFSLVKLEENICKIIAILDIIKITYKEDMEIVISNFDFKEIYDLCLKINQYFRSLELNFQLNIIYITRI